MKLKDFYKRFDGLTREERFRLIELPSQPTSFFYIFQQLTHVRAQKKLYEDKEAHLLAQAEREFEKLDGKHTI